MTEKTTKKSQGAYAYIYLDMDGINIAYIRVTRNISFCHVWNVVAVKLLSFVSPCLTLPYPTAADVAAGDLAP